MSVDGKKSMPHRYAWERERGAIPDEMQIDHICRNRKCCNIRHLRLVTAKQNGEHQSPSGRNTASRVRGVYKSSRSDSWFVQVKHHGELFYGGMFPTVEDANTAATSLRNKLFTHNNLDRIK